MSQVVRKNIGNLVYYLPLLALVGLLVLAMNTSPLRVGPAGILLAFVLLYVGAVGILYTLLRTFMRLLAVVGKPWEITQKKSYYAVSIAALAPVFLLALHSIGQLELKDFVLVFLFVAAATFFLVKR